MLKKENSLKFVHDPTDDMNWPKMVDWEWQVSVKCSFEMTYSIIWCPFIYPNPSINWRNCMCGPTKCKVLVVLVVTIHFASLHCAITLYILQLHIVAPHFRFCNITFCNCATPTLRFTVCHLIYHSIWLDGHTHTLYNQILYLIFWV